MYVSQEISRVVVDGEGSWEELEDEVKF